MPANHAEYAVIPSWHSLGLVPPTEASPLFEDTYYSGIAQVDQGHEEITAGDMLVSRDFTQCSARIVINETDGATLVKHIGPSKQDNVLGGTKGLEPQATYADFMQHAAQMNTRVWALNIRGDTSRHTLENADNLADVPEDTLPDMHVASGDQPWSLVLDPANSTIIIKTTDTSGQDSYEQFQLPRVAPDADTSSAHALVETRLQRQALQSNLKQLVDMPVASPEYVQPGEIRDGILGSKLLSELSPDDIYHIAWRLQRSFVQRAASAANPAEFTAGLEALDIFTNLDAAVVPSDTPMYRKAARLTDMIYEILVDTERANPAAVAMVAPALIARAEEAIKAAADADEGRKIEHLQDRLDLVYSVSKTKPT